MSRPFYSDFFFLVTLFISKRFLRNYWRYRHVIINTPLEPLQPTDVPFGGSKTGSKDLGGIYGRKIDFWLYSRHLAGGFWANRWNITKLFIYLFTYTFLSWTRLQVRPAYGFSRLMAQTMRTRTRMCLLGVSLMLLPNLGVKYPQNPNF